MRTIIHFLTPLGFALCASLAFMSAPSALAKKTDYSVDDDGSARRKNDLKKNQIQGIREHFIGREIVMRVNWRARNIIHEGLVVHPFETTNTGRQKAKKSAFDYGDLQSPAGETSTIVGMNFLHHNDIYIFLKTSRGTRATLGLRAPKKSKNSFKELSHKFITTAWMEEQLTNQAVRFLPKQKAINPRAIRLVSAPASEGLSLDMPTAPTPPHRAAPSMFASYLSSLRISAIPQGAERGQSVLLKLEYEISGRETNSIPVIETRTLRYNGKTLPGYPLSKQFNRTSGVSESSYRQSIPHSAKSGNYEYKGEVCVNGECISRVITISVR